MKNFWMTLILIISFMFCVSCSNTIVQPFREVPDPDLEEITMIRTMHDGATAVIYNPDTCKEIGEACGFFPSSCIRA